MVLNFKLAIVNEELKQLMRSLQDPAVASDNTRCSQIMNRCSELMKIQQLLAKVSGEKILLR